MCELCFHVFLGWTSGLSTINHKANQPLQSRLCQTKRHSAGPVQLWHRFRLSLCFPDNEEDLLSNRPNVMPFLIFISYFLSLHFFSRQILRSQGLGTVCPIKHTQPVKSMNYLIRHINLILIERTVFESKQWAANFEWGANLFLALCYERLGTQFLRFFVTWDMIPCQK